MAELIDTVASWQALVLVLIVFGIAPGILLRLIVLAYSKNNMRRRELIAELYTVPRIERPLWVAEQFEVALCEGLGQRLRVWRRLRRRIPEEQGPIRERLYLSVGCFGSGTSSILLWLPANGPGFWFLVVNSGILILCGISNMIPRTVIRAWVRSWRSRG
jgi:hypothetical protein